MSTLSLAGLSMVLMPLLAAADLPRRARLDVHGFPLPPGAIARLGDLRFAQPGTISALAVSPDEKLIATAAERVVRFWDPATGRIVRELPAPYWVKQLLFSKDGRLLAAGSTAGELLVWNVGTGEVRWRLEEPAPEPKKEVIALRFLDREGLLAVAHEEPRIQMFDARTGKRVGVWTVDKRKQAQLDACGAGYEFTAVALSPSGNLMAWLAGTGRSSRDQDKPGAAFLYETVSGRLTRQLKPLRKPADLVHLLDEGQTLLLQLRSGSSFDHHNRVVRVADGKERFSFPTRIRIFISRFAPPEPPQVMHVAAERGEFITLDEGGMIRWEMRTGKKLAEWREGCTALAFSADGKRAIMARGARLELCDGQLKRLRPNTDFPGPPWLSYLPDGRLVASWGFHGRVHLWDPPRGRLLESLWCHEAPPTGKTPCSHDQVGTRFVYHKDKQVVVHDLLADRPVCRLAGVRLKDEQKVWGVWPEFSPDGKRVLLSTPEANGLVVRWFDSGSGRELGRYAIPTADLFPGQFRHLQVLSDDGNVFGYVTPDARLKLVDWREGKVCLTVGIPVPPPAADDEANARFPEWTYYRLAGGAFLAGERSSEAVAGRREFALWDRRTGQLLRRFYIRPEGAKKSSWPWALSPDGRFLALHLGNGKGVNLYETTSGRWRGEVLAPNEVHHFAFAPDGATLATSCADTTVLIWDVNRPLSGRPPLPAPRSAADCERLWERLGERDAAAAEQALWALVRAPEQTLPLLRQKLHPVCAPYPVRLRKAIAQLDSQAFKEREDATRELTNLGELALPGLRAALQQATVPLEQRRRVQQLVERLEDPARVPPRLRELRAVEVLERLASADACRLLETLATGCADAQLTGEARLALQRLRRR